MKIMTVFFRVLSSFSIGVISAMALSPSRWYEAIAIGVVSGFIGTLLANSVLNK